MADLAALLQELTCGDDARAEAAAAQLADAGVEAVPALLSLLGSEDTDHRWWATRALAAIDQLSARSGLVHALSDADASVRQCAALGLRSRPTAQAIPGLVPMLGGSDPLLARLAADALAAVGAEAVAPLLQVATSGSPRARIEAARALARMEDRQAVPALLALLDDPSAVVQYWADEGLERMGLGMVFFEP